MSTTTFKFTRYNTYRRASRRPAAEVEVTTDGESEFLWMDRDDIRKNIATFGTHPELVAAFEAYQLNKPFPPK